MGPAASRPTADLEVDLRRARRGRTIRRAFVSLLVVFLALGVAGVFGVRSATVAASGGGFELKVDYARVTRPGLAAPWKVTIRHPGGFEGAVKVATTSQYLTMFDQNNLEPEPQSTTTDGERVIWEFDVPEGSDTLEISLDASTSPNARWRFSGVTAVLEDEAPVVHVQYSSMVMP